MLHHPRPHRIELDIAITGEKVLVGVDQRRAVSALPECPRALVRVVEVPDVIAPHALHGLADPILGLRRDQQVDVVCHQHVGVDGTAMLAAGGREFPVEEAVVVVAAEDRLAIIAPLNDVLGMTTEHKTREPRHGNPTNALRRRQGGLS
jgi:hypothetical protein